MSKSMDHGKEDADAIFLWVRRSTWQSRNFSHFSSTFLTFIQCHLKFMFENAKWILCTMSVALIDISWKLAYKMVYYANFFMPILCSDYHFTIFWSRTRCTISDNSARNLLQYLNSLKRETMRNSLLLIFLSLLFRWYQKL